MTMELSVDWYPSNLAKQRLMYQNVNTKIDSYQTKYGLTAAVLAEVHTICGTFIAAYDKVEQNRATGKQMTDWFENILKGNPAGDPVPAAPVFQAFALPAGAFVGIEQKFRDFVRDFKNNAAYTEADGADLMIVAQEPGAVDLNTVAPQIAVLADPNGVVTVNWRKGSFSALELQYRAAGATNWQMADKSTETPVHFTPPLINNQPQKFDFRAIYLLKNERVGQWSIVHTVTVG